MVALGVTHCGAGCTLADIVAEWTLFVFPLTLFGMKIFGAWTVDYFVALVFGIVFQYFTIAPMRELSLGPGLAQAAKADFLSLTAWQVGMYGWMAIATFLTFGHEIEKTNPVFWFMMQIAMLVGFRGFSARGSRKRCDCRAGVERAWEAFLPNERAFSVGLAKPRAGWALPRTPRPPPHLQLALRALPSPDRMNFAELKGLYDQPLFDLIAQSRAVHLEHWRGEQVQRCSLLSIKTGGCSEDCAYCAQSAHYSTGVGREELMPVDEVMSAAQRARAQGATRFCMGAAWRGVRDGTEKFEQVLATVRAVSQLGMEVCVTLGEIGPDEARKLKSAGVTAYNHNIDTSPEFYPEIVRTHSFADRLTTIAAVQESGMSVCCGGIIGLGERVDDRLRMLEVLSSFDPPPESVPINCLMAMPGTPLAEQPPVDIFDLVRLIAVTRLAIPRARVRLAAGRTRLTREGQALCFFAGANSIFYGDKLLTARNPAADADVALLRELGLQTEPKEEPADICD